MWEGLRVRTRSRLKASSFWEEKAVETGSGRTGDIDGEAWFPPERQRVSSQNGGDVEGEKDRQTQRCSISVSCSVMHPW